MVNRWRRMRKGAHEALGLNTSKKYRPVQEQEALRLTKLILETPQHWEDHAKLIASSAILSISFGLPPLQDTNDPIFRGIFEHQLRAQRSSLPGAYLVDIIPWMMYLPDWMAKWKRDGKRYHQQDTALFEGLLDQAQQRDAESDTPSMASLIMKKGLLGRKEAAWLAGNML